MASRRKALLVAAAVLLLAGIGVGMSGIASGGGDVRHPVAAQDARARRSATSTTPPLIPAPTPPVHTVPVTQQTSYVPPPYISEAHAEMLALQTAQTMGAGGRPRAVAAKLESVARASHDAGFRVASFFTTTDRMVWLVWIVGPYQGQCLNGPTTCPVQKHELYNVVIDAKSGANLGVGSSRVMPGAPPVPAGTHFGPPGS